MFYRERLLSELVQRQARNPSYSLRSFASSLGLSPTLLSHLLSGKRSLTHRTASLLSQRLALDPQASARLQAEAGEARKPDAHERKPMEQVLSVDEFRRIADWEHYAVLALADVKGNRLAPAWIAQRLNISPKRAAEVLQRLLSLGYLEKKGTGFRQIVPRLATTQDLPSAAIQSYHAQNLEKAKASLLGDPVEERYFGSATFAIDPADLSKFKKFLRNTRNCLEHMSVKSAPKRVYHFSVQLFPIDKGDHQDETRH